MVSAADVNIVAIGAYDARLFRVGVLLCCCGVWIPLRELVPYALLYTPCTLFEFTQLSDGVLWVCSQSSLALLPPRKAASKAQRYFIGVYAEPRIPRKSAVQLLNPTAIPVPPEGPPVRFFKEDVTFRLCCTGTVDLDPASPAGKQHSKIVTAIANLNATEEVRPRWFECLCACGQSCCVWSVLLLFTGIFVAVGRAVFVDDWRWIVR